MTSKQYQNSFFVLLLCFITSLVSYGQTSYTLSGSVQDKSTHVTLPDVKLTILTPKNIEITDSSGYFFFSLPPGVYQLDIRCIGYKSITKTISLQENKNLEIELEEKNKELEAAEVHIKKRNQVTDPNMGQIELEMKKIKTLPAFMGEVDILKTIQLLPGVSSVSEGGQGFYVRGGGPDQNLVLVDEVPVYNASHLFGFFSVFNSDAVKSGNLIKGGMPANYGGRMSSVLEIKTNDGDQQKVNVKGGIGLISSRLTIDGPINKGKGAFMVAGRRTYVDVLMKPFISSTSPFNGSAYFFYDLNFKANYTLGKKDKLFFSSYLGIDKFTFSNKTDGFNVEIPWGNKLAALRWNHQFSPYLVMNATSYTTNYSFGFGSKQDVFSIALNSEIHDLGEKIEFTSSKWNKHKIKYGLDYIFHTFLPSSLSVEQGETPFNTQAPQKLRSHETAFFVNDEYEITDKWKVNLGLRYSMYQFVGPFTRHLHNTLPNQATSIEYANGKPIKSFGGLEPRISSRYLFKDKSSLKFGYAFNYQYIHLTSLSTLSLPTDIWLPSTDVAKPQSGYQISIGYYKNIFKDKVEISVEAYYKGMKNLIEYKPGALPQDNFTDNIDNLLVFGTGKSYGIEFFIRKNVGKFNGWIGYTLAKTERFFPDIQATPFPAKYDRRHDLCIVGSYELNEKWTFGAVFVYATGNTLTLPSSWYLHDQNLLFDYNARNSTRMPSYHRLDVSATRFDSPTKKIYNSDLDEYVDTKKRFRSNWSFSVYNVYNHANPFFLFLQGNGKLVQGNFSLRVKQVSLFPIIPSVTWNFSF
jgi:hypothetical protein